MSILAELADAREGCTEGSDRGIGRWDYLEWQFPAGQRAYLPIADGVNILLAQPGNRPRRHERTPHFAPSVSRNANDSHGSILSRLLKGEKHNPAVARCRTDHS